MFINTWGTLNDWRIISDIETGGRDSKSAARHDLWLAPRRQALAVSVSRWLAVAVLRE